MTRFGITLSPLDTLFFRDGRPFNAADQATGGLPTPLPLAGALRTAILAGESNFCFKSFANSRRSHHQKEISEALKDAGLSEAWSWYRTIKFRGPWLALQLPNSDTTIPLLSVPHNLVRVEKPDQPTDWLRSRPLPQLPGWVPPKEIGNQYCPLWRKTARDEKYPGGFLTLPAIRHFLNDEDGLISDQEWFRESDLFQFDSRTGIGIDKHRLTASDSQIYGIRLLSLAHRVQRNWCAPESLTEEGSEKQNRPPKYEGARVILYAEIMIDGDYPTDLQERLTGPIPFGGEGRYVDCRPLSQPVEWQDHPVAENGQHCWLLASPGLFGNRHPLPWVPDTIETNQLHAASSGTAFAVSGWDVARNGPRPTRFAIPAGSVYFTEGNIQLHHDSLCSDPEDIAQGWGFALTGVYK